MAVAPEPKRLGRVPEVPHGEVEVQAPMLDGHLEHRPLVVFAELGVLALCGLATSRLVQDRANRRDA